MAAVVAASFAAATKSCLETQVESLSLNGEKVECTSRRSGDNSLLRRVFLDGSRDCFREASKKRS